MRFQHSLFASSTFVAARHGVNARSIALRTGLMLISTILPFLILRITTIHGPADTYVSMTFLWHKLFLKLLQFTQVLPDYFLSLLISIPTITCLLIKRYRQPDFSLAAAFSLLVSAIVATAALICFDSFSDLLLYIWLPIYCFLIPCLAYSLKCIASLRPSPRKLAKAAIALTFFAVLVTQLPVRFVQAQFQFDMDTATAQLANQVSIVRTSNHEVIGAIPVFSVSASEVPEHIECFVRDKLQPRYYDSKEEKFDEYKFAMLNFLTLEPDITRPGDPEGVFRMPTFRSSQLAYTRHCPDGYKGWTGFQVVAGSTPYQAWIKRPFTEGALLLVPYGDLQPAKVGYRGATIFATGWQAQLASLPQLKFRELGSVRRKIHLLTGHNLHLGWKIMQVESN